MASPTYRKFQRKNQLSDEEKNEIISAAAIGIIILTYFGERKYAQFIRDMANIIQELDSYDVIQQFKGTGAFMNAKSFVTNSLSSSSSLTAQALKRLNEQKELEDMLDKMMKPKLNETDPEEEEILKNWISRNKD